MAVQEASNWKFLQVDDNFFMIIDTTTRQALKCKGVHLFKSVNEFSDLFYRTYRKTDFGKENWILFLALIPDTFIDEEYKIGTNPR